MAVAILYHMKLATTIITLTTCKSYTQAIATYIASCKTTHLSGRGHGFGSQLNVQNVLGNQTS